MSRAPIGGVSEISTTGVSEISTAGGERNGEGLLNLGFLGEVVTLWVRGFPDLVLTQKKRPSGVTATFCVAAAVGCVVWEPGT